MRGASVLQSVKRSSPQLAQESARSIPAGSPYWNLEIASKWRASGPRQLLRGRAGKGLGAAGLGFGKVGGVRAQLLWIPKLSHRAQRTMWERRYEIRQLDRCLRASTELLLLVRTPCFVSSGPKMAGPPGKPTQTVCLSLLSAELRWPPVGCLDAETRRMLLRPWSSSGAPAVCRRTPSGALTGCIGHMMDCSSGMVQIAYLPVMCRAPLGASPAPLHCCGPLSRRSRPPSRHRRLVIPGPRLGTRRPAGQTPMASSSSGRDTMWDGSETSSSLPPPPLVYRTFVGMSLQYLSMTRPGNK